MDGYIRSDGTFEIEKLIEGTYLARALHRTILFQTFALNIVQGESRQLSFLPLGGSVSGVLTASDGQPIANAPVFLIPAEGATSTPRTASTGADGTYSFVGIESGFATLTSVADGYAQSSVSINAQAGQQITRNLIVTQGIALSGRAVTNNGNPISKATVYLKDIAFPDAPLLSRITDSDGQWVVANGSPGSYLFVALSEKIGSAVSEITIPSTGLAPDVVLLIGNASVSGSVRVDGLPVKNALVTLLLNGVEIRQVTTDEFGEYSIEGVANGSYILRFDELSAESLVQGISLNGTVIVDGDLVACPACSISVLELVGDSASSFAARSTPPGINLPSGETLKLDLDNLFLYREILNDEYNRVTSIPWEPIASIPALPAEPNCFCNSPAVKSEYERLKSERITLIAISLSEQLEKLERLALDATLRAGANTTYGVVSTKLFLAVGKYGQYSDLKSQIESILGGSLALFPPTQLAALIVAAKAVLEAFLGTLDSARYALDTYKGYIAAIESNRNAFNSSATKFNNDVVRFIKNIDNYNNAKNDEATKCSFPGSPGGSATVAKGEGKVVLLLTSEDRAALAKLSANGVTWYIEEVSNPSGSGVSITPNGGAIVGDGDCGTFVVVIRLIIECDDAVLFGLGKTRQIFNGTFNLTRTPIEIPFNLECGGDKPDDTDCFKYFVTFTGDCGSVDPNDILGPGGVGVENWIRGGGPYEYMIRFENDPEEASAPAAVVRIEQILDSDLDFTSFQLGAFGFGSYSFSDASGLSSFSKRFDFVQEFGVILDVMAGIDVTSGIATWEIRSIDPATGNVPFSPLVGFLPPNVDGVEGQGFVTYSIRTKDTTGTGSVIDAVADIVFDQNESIVTPPIFNTIDADPPTSEVISLNLQSYPGFLVSWTGEDLGSGVSQYDIYFTKDDGPVTPWLTGTALTQANFFNASPGGTYAFFSAATDRVGFRKNLKAVPDASTLVLEPVSMLAVVSTATSISASFSGSLPWQTLIDDNDISQMITIRDSSYFSVMLTDVVFSYSDVTHQLNLSWGNPLPSGEYSFSIDTSAFQTEAGSQLAVGWGGERIQMRSSTGSHGFQVGGTDLLLRDPVLPLLFDLDGDSLVDLIVPERTGQFSSKLRFYRNLGEASAPRFDGFTYLQSTNGDLILDDPQPQVRLHDWNGDGEPDLIVGRSDGRIQVFINVNTVADPIFALPRFVTYSQDGASQPISFSTPASPVWIDWDSNGRKDLLLADSDGQLRVFLDQAMAGAPRFTTSLLVMLGENPFDLPNSPRIAAGDLNGDGRFDLILGSSGNQLLYYPNIGSNSEPRFVAGWSVDVSSMELSTGASLVPDLADLNGDDNFDVFVGTSSGQLMALQLAGAFSPLSRENLVIQGDSQFSSYIFSVMDITDTLPPTVAITLDKFSLIDDETATVTFTFSEAVVGFDLDDVTVESGTLSKFSGDGIIFTSTFTPTANLVSSTNTISVGTGYSDVAGNPGTAGTSNNFSIDTRRFVFGDAPTAEQSGFAFSYPVTRAQNGARHVVGELFLGASVIATGDGNPHPEAGGNPNDDGVVFLSFLVTTDSNTSAGVRVVASRPGKLDGWIDFNGDGDWLDSGEQIFVSTDVVAGENLLSFTIPAGAASGNTAARFRLSTVGGLAPTGAADDGEVEDCWVRIVAGSSSAVVEIDVPAGETILGTDGSDLVVKKGDLVIFQAPLTSFGKLNLNGSPLDDIFQFTLLEALATKTMVIDGGLGKNTLRLVDSGQTLDLTSEAVTLRDVETIDIRGTGDNSLVINIDSVKAVSSTTDTLEILSNVGDTITFAAGWRAEMPRFIDGQFTHIISEAVPGGTARVEVRNDRFLQNPLNRFDVDRNGSIEPLDALLVLNSIVQMGIGQAALPSNDDEISTFYPDVSGDDDVTPLDALLILNAITRINRGVTPEGEMVSPPIGFSLSHFERETQCEEIDVAITEFESIDHVSAFYTADETRANVLDIDDWMQELGTEDLIQEAEGVRSHLEAFDDAQGEGMPLS